MMQIFGPILSNCKPSSNFITCGNTKSLRKTDRSQARDPQTFQLTLRIAWRLSPRPYIFAITQWRSANSHHDIPQLHGDMSLHHRPLPFPYLYHNIGRNVSCCCHPGKTTVLIAVVACRWEVDYSRQICCLWETMEIIGHEGVSWYSETNLSPQLESIQHREGALQNRRYQSTDKHNTTESTGSSGAERWLPTTVCWTRRRSANANRLGRRRWPVWPPADPSAPRRLCWRITASAVDAGPPSVTGRAPQSSGPLLLPGRSPTPNPRTPGPRPPLSGLPTPDPQTSDPRPPTPTPHPAPPSPDSSPCPDLSRPHPTLQPWVDSASLWLAPPAHTHTQPQTASHGGRLR